MDFGAFLGGLLEKRGLSVAEFARQVGLRPPHIFAIKSGDRPLAEKHFAKWADALELSGKERERFIEECYLTQAPQPVRDMVERLRKQAARARD